LVILIFGKMMKNLVRHSPSEPPAARLHVFADSEQFGRRLARTLGLGCARVGVHMFPDGESLVRIRPPAGQHAILVRSLHDPNPKLLETLLAADALRRADAQQVTLIAPYLPYMRQDRIFRPGEPISQHVIGSCLGQAFDRVLTIEAHLHRITRLSDVIPGRAQSLSAAPVLAEWIQRTVPHSLLVGPDAESEPWVRAIAQKAQTQWVIGTKERLGDRKVRITFPGLPVCEHAVIVDDIASSGETLAVAAQELRRQGVPSVDAVVVHAIFAPQALSRIRAAGIDRIISGDSIPHPTNGLSVIPVFATALKKIVA
jgi:ribose-phosphate pyrophosphokinase